MTAENFCYWLQGWFELNKTIDHREGATKETLDMIKRHLELVFTNVSSTPCGEQLVDAGIKWESDYYRDNEPSSICNDLPPLPEFPRPVRVRDFLGRTNNETHYC